MISQLGNSLAAGAFLKKPKSTEYIAYMVCKACHLWLSYGCFDWLDSNLNDLPMNDLPFA